MKFFKGKKNPKIIIIEDGVVNTNEMCIITIPRSKEPSILYAKKRDLAGPNVDRPKKTKQFNVMEELLRDRAGRPFGKGGIGNASKVVSRPQRYNKFQEALARNEKLTKRLEELGKKMSQEEQKMPTKYEKIQTRNDRLTLRLEQLGKEFGDAEKKDVHRNDETQYRNLAFNPALSSTRRRPRNEMLNLDETEYKDIDFQHLYPRQPTAPAPILNTAQDSIGSIASRFENPSWIHDSFTPPAESTKRELYWDSFEGQDDTPPCLMVEPLVLNVDYNKPGVDLGAFNSKSESGKFYSIANSSARDATTVNDSLSRRPAPRINPTTQGIYPDVLDTSCSSACSSPASRSMQPANEANGFVTIPDFSMNDGSYNQSGQIDSRHVQGMTSPASPSMRKSHNSSFNPFVSRNNFGSPAVRTTPVSQRNGPLKNNVSTLRNRAWRNTKPPVYRLSPSLPRHSFPDSETIGDSIGTDDNFQYSQRSNLIDSATERGYDQVNTPPESNLPRGSWEDVSPWLFSARRPRISAITSDNTQVNTPPESNLPRGSWEDVSPWLFSARRPRISAITSDNTPPIDNSYLNQRQWEDPSSIWEDSPSEQFNVQNPCLQPVKTSRNTPQGSQRLRNRLWDASPPSSFNAKYSCLNPIKASIPKPHNWENSPDEQFNTQNPCLQPVKTSRNTPQGSQRLRNRLLDASPPSSFNAKYSCLNPIKTSIPKPPNWEDSPDEQFNAQNTCLKPIKTGANIPRESKHMPHGVREAPPRWQSNAKPRLSPIKTHVKHLPQQNWEDPPPWLFNSKNPCLNPTKTYTIMAPDNSHFQRSKSSDFNNFPNIPPYDCSYETEYGDINDCKRNISGGCSLLQNVSPPANRDYYSLIEETEDHDAQGSCFSKDTRSRENQNFIREHELVNIYDD